MNKDVNGRLIDWKWQFGWWIAADLKHGTEWHKSNKAKSLGLSKGGHRTGDGTGRDNMACPVACVDSCGRLGPLTARRLVRRTGKQVWAALWKLGRWISIASVGSVVRFVVLIDHLAVDRLLGILLEEETRAELGLWPRAVVAVQVDWKVSQGQMSRTRWLARLGRNSHEPCLPRKSEIPEPLGSYLHHSPCLPLFSKGQSWEINLSNKVQVARGSADYTARQL
jgi:hypothetical protein